MFYRVISQEISKLVSKGNHSNISIREMIQGQNLEEKAQYQMNKGTIGRKIIPQKLT